MNKKLTLTEEELISLYSCITNKVDSYESYINSLPKNTTEYLDAKEYYINLKNIESKIKREF